MLTAKSFPFFGCCHDTITHPNYLLVGGPTPVIHEIGLTCDSALVVLTDTATADAPGLTYTGYWDYGDGYLDTGNVVMHQYKIADSITAVGYEYVVIVTDNIGCSSTAMGQIVVRHPVAGFVPSTYFPCIGSGVYFDNTTIFFPVPASTHMVYQWTFGDGSAVDTNHSPTHAYTDTGSYTVQLIATDASGTGCSDTITHVLKVNQPAAGFYMPDSTGVCVPHTVHFVNTSTGSTGLTMTYAWAFGNGNTSALSTPTNSYDTAGVYTVTLTATDSNGCSSTATGHVQVFGYTGAFTDIPPTGCAPLAVLFHAAGSGVADTITWDFRDSTATVSYEHTDSSLLHVFVNAGYYVPRLILKSNEGCSSVSYAADTVKVYGAPKLGASASAGSVCTGLSVTLTATDTAAIATSYTWYGTTGSGMSGAGTTGATQTVTPTGSGTFVYTVIATTEHGCSDTATVSVTTGTANVTVAGGTSLCMGSHETLTARNTGGGTMTYAWTPTGIGVSPTTGASVVFTPTVSGVYTIIATGTNGGCTDTGVLVVTVSALPTAGITGTGTCLGGTATLHFTGTPNATIHYHINPGGADSTITLDSTGNATKTLTPTAAGVTQYQMSSVTSLQGCTSPLSGLYNLAVISLPTVDVSSNFSICKGASASLTVTGAYMYSWSPAIIPNPSPLATTIMVTPSVTTTYTVTGTPPGGSCTNKDSVTVTVNEVRGEDNTLCQFMGDSLNAVGATTYTWTDLTGAVSPTLSCSACLHPVPSPTVTTMYLVTGNNGCKDTMTVIVPTDDHCDPCKSFGGKPFHTIAGTTPTVSSLVPGDDYYFANNVTIQNVNGANAFGPTVVLQNNVIYMEQEIRVTIPAKTTVELRHDHLFACPTHMWRGIFVTSQSPNTAKVRIDSNTLIEDARIAVYDSTLNPFFTPGSTDTAMRVLCDGAIFNKDSIGIYLRAVNTSFFLTDTVLPYRVRNSVFTSRSFNNYMSAGGTYYPNAWPKTTGALSALKAPWYPGNQFDAPYNIANPAADTNGSPYTWTLCNNGKKAYTGIYMYHLAADTSTAYYTSVVLGDTAIADTAFSMNLFDSLQYGIQALGTNLLLYNSAFSGDSVGVNAATFAAGGGTNTANFRINILGNKFYNCIGGLDVYYIARLLCTGNSFTSNHLIGNYALATGEGVRGVFVSGKVFNTWDVEHNSFANIKTGINYSVLNVPGTIGDMTASYNTIDACPSCGTMGNTYVDQGITISSATPGVSTLTPGTIHIEHNSIVNAFRPISANNFTKTQVITNHNYAKMVYNAVAATTLNPALSGIEHIQCNGSIITNNEIRGQGTNSPTQGSAYNVARQIGIHLSGNGALPGGPNPLIQCNLTDTINAGIQFDGAYTVTWKGNTMQATRYGMVLYTSANIGQQISSTAASDNVWDAGTAWSLLGNVQTFTSGAATVSGTVSTLFVRGNAPYKPTVNNGTGSINLYSTSTGSITVITPVDSPYMCTDGYGKLTSAQSHETTAATALYEQIAGDSLIYSVNANTARWMAQMSLWEAIQLDSTITDSSIVLQQFKAMAGNSRYALLTNIGNAVANNNQNVALALLGQDIDAIADTAMDTVIGVVMADNVAADYLVNNYRNYYSLYIKYMDSTLTADDSMQVSALANKCPMTDGMIIYQARSLYTLLYGTMPMYGDRCNLPQDSTRARHTNSSNGTPGLGIITKDNQQYSLRPNPNDGQMYLMQSQTNNEPVTVNVWSAAGVSVYNGQMQFTDKQAMLNLKDVAPGFYLIEITDSKGNRFDSKVVIEK